MPSVTALLACLGLRAEYGDSPPSSNCRAQRLTVGVRPVTATGAAAAVEELSAAIARRSSLAASSASCFASSVLSCAVSLPVSVDEELSLLFLRLLLNSVIHLSRSLSSMTRNRTHSLELNSCGSISRIRSWLAAKCLLAIERGRFVTASTCNTPNPPFLIAGVLYIAGLCGRAIEGIFGNPIPVGLTKRN